MGLQQRVRLAALVSMSGAMNCLLSSPISRSEARRLPRLSTRRCPHVCPRMCSSTSTPPLTGCNGTVTSGDEDMPIILLSIGASCRFGVMLSSSGKRERCVVSLHSGDVILFGGPSRFVEHAVLAVQLGTRPAWMASPDSCRVSLTFRESPSILGHENRFRNFDLSNGVKECFERSQREWREGDPLVECNC